MAHSFDAITNPPPDLGGGLRHLLILTLSPSERIRLDYPSLYKSGRDQKDESDIRKQAILLWTPGNSVLPMKGKSSIPGTFFSYHIIPIRFYRDYCHQNYDTSMTQYNAQWYIAIYDVGIALFRAISVYLYYAVRYANDALLPLLLTIWHIMHAFHP